MSCGFCAVTPVSNCPVCGTAGTDPKNAPAVNVPIRSAKGRSAQRRYGQTRAARNAAALRNAPVVPVATPVAVQPTVSAAEASFQNTRRALMARLETLGKAALAAGNTSKANELRRLWYAARDSKFTPPAPAAPQVETLRPVSPALPFALPNECVDYKAANPGAVCDDAARRAFEASKASGPLARGDWAGLYARVAAGTMTDDEAKRIGHEWIHGKAEKETPAAPNMPAAQA